MAHSMSICEVRLSVQIHPCFRRGTLWTLCTRCVHKVETKDVIFTSNFTCCVIARLNVFRASGSNPKKCLSQLITIIIIIIIIIMKHRDYKNVLSFSEIFTIFREPILSVSVNLYLTQTKSSSLWSL